MSGALIELVSRGVADTHLTGQPEISFWRQNFKRHTPFSMKPERLDYIGTFAANNEITIPIVSKGDLLSYVWIEAPGIATADTASSPSATGLHGSTAANPTEFSLWIGGQQVCVLDTLFIQGVHNVLYNTDQAKASGAVTTSAVKNNSIGAYSATTGDHYFIPFFFGNGDLTRALPLVAMQYHSAEIKIKCRDGFTPVTTPRVYGQFIFLDSAERQFFTENEHQLLITQTQYQLAESTDTEFDLTYFNHPCRAFHLVNGKSTDSNWATEYNFDKATLYVNGVAHTENMSNVYHHTIVPQMHCSVLPDNELDNVPVYTWSFAAKLNSAQPSGSINASRIDTMKINVTSPTGGNSLHRMYAVNWNVLKVSKGLAGVMYGN
jgi:hypothetical protein